MIAFLVGGSLTALFLWAIVTPTRQERARQSALEELLAATPPRSGRGQKLNPAGVAAIPVVTSSVVPEPPPPPGGRPAHTEVFVCTCVWRGGNDGLPRL